MTVNRATPPELQPIEELYLQAPEQQSLSNGIAVYYIDTGAVPITQLEFIIEGGTWQAEHPLIAQLTHKMLREGTDHYTSREIAHKIDFYGARFKLQQNEDYAGIVLQSSNKNLPDLLPLLRSMLTEASFPSSEFNTLVNNERQALARYQQETSFVARHKSYELLFGPEHPYGYYPSIEDYDEINIQQLKQHYKHTYVPANTRVIVAGQLPENISNLLEQHFGNWSGQTRTHPGKSYSLQGAEQRKHRIEMEGSIQSSIRISQRTINRNHPDYPQLKILNTFLGGYFSSRLMRNIREEKGYTYGIYSLVRSFFHEGCWHVTTETGNEYVEAVIDEIYKEIERLKTESIPEDELVLVRNYMQGNLLTSIDGPFALALFLKMVLLHGQTYDYYYRLLKQIKTLKAKDLQKTAQKYLKTENLYEIVVGERS